MSPSVATIKRLFGVSGNQCAFPKCKNALIEPVSGKVTGRVCHIKAQSKDGPRYDVKQTDEERHHFDNLILMCPIHHDVIDADPEAYTVDRLAKIKKEHEESVGQVNEPTDMQAQDFIININSNQIANGSIIFTHNQMGGQVAHSITNIGKQQRVIHPAAAIALIDTLKQFPPEKFNITCLLNDVETYQLSDRLDKILGQAGWRSDGVEQSVFTGVPVGVIIETPKVTPSLNYLLNWCNAAGLNPSGIVDPTSNTINIIVGVQK